MIGVKEKTEEHVVEKKTGRSVGKNSVEKKVATPALLFDLQKVRRLGVGTCLESLWSCGAHRTVDEART